MIAGCFHFGDCRADHLHFIDGEAVAAHDVASAAGSLNVSLNVGKGVVDPVQTAIFRDSSAIDARLLDKLQNLGSGHVARIGSLICFAKEYRAAFVRPAVFQVPSLLRLPLIWRHAAPTLFAAIPTKFAGSVTLLAFICQPQRAASVSQEYIRRGWQKLLAAVAIPEAIFGRNKPLSHVDGVA